MSPAPADIASKVTELLRRLVAFDTESAKSNLPLVAFVEDYLTSLGIAHIRIANDTADKAAIFATVGPAVDGGVVLSAHTDVVPVEGQTWNSNPFALRESEQRLYGRGTCDMKGFVAIVLAMLPEWQAAGLKRPVHILLSYDEETTCLGPVATIARFGHDLPRPALAIVGEPTLMQAADAQKSVATYVTTVIGHEAHSAKPALGANAIASACALVCELYRLQDVYEREGDPSGRFDPGYSTVHVGTIHGGTARNILARECRIHWEFRGLPGVAIDSARRQFESFVQKVELPRLRRFVPDPSIVTEVEVEVPGLNAEPGSSAETLVLKLLQSNRTIAVPFATEAGRFQEAGVPTIVCGPGNIDQAHQPDEFIERSQIEACIVFMRRLGVELAR